MRTLVFMLLLAACNVPATTFTPGSGSGDAGTGGSGDAGTAGSGDAGTTQTPAMLSVSPSGDVALGTVIIGQASAEATLTVSNDGDLASGTIDLSLDDTTTGFAITHDGCSTTSLAGHTTCTFGLTFTPTSSAAVQTNLHITADPGGAVMKVVLGSGIVQGQIDITDASYTFANQGLGATMGTKVFTVRNTGQSQIGVPMPTISGDASYKVQSTTCSAPLNQTDTCTVTVQFAPTSVGQKAGSLVVSASPGGSDAASLSGTAFAHVTVTTSGSGTITSTPAGISCPSTCAADFTSSPVSLTATPATNQMFAGWSGACSGTGGCSLTLDAAKAVTGAFSAKLYPVTVGFTSGNTSGSNTITSSPAGINCDGTNGCTGMFPFGSSVTITANPDATWGRFVSWSSGPCAGSTNPVCTFTVPSGGATLNGSFTWFATMTILANQGVSGNSPTPSQVNANDGTLACTNTTTLAGTCVMHYGRNTSITLTYYGNPTTNWTNCPASSGSTVRTLDGTGAGSCAPPSGAICAVGQTCKAETCTMAFTSAGDYTSGLNVSCVTSTVGP